MINKVIILGITCFLVTIPWIVRADDTAVFVPSISVPPNVLFLLDTSGSMAWDTSVVTPTTGYFNPNTIYATATTKDCNGTSFVTNKLYYKTTGGCWSPFPSTSSPFTFSTITVADGVVVSGGVTTSQIECGSAVNSINLYGHWQGLLIPPPYDQYADGEGKSHQVLYNIRTGNYLNYYYDNSVTSMAKITYAKQVMSNLVTATSNVRFGLMVYNTTYDSSYSGGKLIVPLTTNVEALNYGINNLPDPSNGTPTAEALAEAGNYFARQNSWYTGVNYNNPITYKKNATQTLTSDKGILWRCQKNFVIYITDGISTLDQDARFSNGTNYLGIAPIGDFDGDTTGTSPRHSSELNDSTNTVYPGTGSDYLDDVAKFLYDKDLLPNASVMDSGGISFNASDYPKQNVVTYTIGFDTDQELLVRAADKNHGNGQYFTTSESSNLQDILENIITDILSKNDQFVAPVVPVNRVNKTYAGNGIYMGIFAPNPDPDQPGIWKGNLKKFGYNKLGQILSKDGAVAVNSNGTIKPEARSAWVDTSSSSTEGLQVDLGGAGAELLTQSISSRIYKTYKTGTGPGTGFLPLVSGSTDIGFGAFGLTAATQSNDLIDFVTAKGVYTPVTGTKARNWMLGDILHSQPAVLYDFSNHKNAIFVGANDGFLHCFVDDDNNTIDTIADDSVTEAWAFTPWDLLPNLRYLPSLKAGITVVPGDNEHDFYVDGSPVLYKTGNHKYIAFGLRRGGMDLSTKATTKSLLDHQYFILNIDNYSSPAWAGQIATGILGTGSESLGQSWCTPRFSTIRTGSGANDKADVLLLTGGYDTNQDNANPGAGDSKGRAVFAVNAADGSITANLNNLKISNSGGYTPMRYSMVDITSYDDNGDGCDDVIYAPSVGGDLFVFESKMHTDGTYDGVWSKRRLFSAAPSGGATSYSTLRKFLYAPAIAQELWGDFVYIGSGNRENPNEIIITNRFYAIRNTWPATWNDNTPITDSNLTDVTADNTQGTIATPSTWSSSDIKDYNNNLLTGSGWFITLENAGEKMVSTPIVVDKVIYFTTFTPSALTCDKCKNEDGTGRLWAIKYLTGEAAFAGFQNVGSGGSIVPGGNPRKEDRNTIIGSGMPTSPTMVLTENGTIIQTDGLAFNPNGPTPLTRYYWRKQ
jgi:type IV pilus assembly protein PilY1